MHSAMRAKHTQTEQVQPGVDELCMRRSGAHFSLACLAVLVSLMNPMNSTPQEEKFHIDRTDSFVVAVTGKSGLFSFAAHEHAIIATKWSINDSIKPDRFGSVFYNGDGSHGFIGHR